MHNWNSDLIRAIFSQKQREKSEDRDNLLKLVSKSLYGEAIHYALELIQNAEDEDSSFIKFIFDKDRVTVINDGKSFDDDDVWGICSVRTGRKRGRIGFFGIGFKAVFNVSPKPQIISREFNFELNDFIYPSSLENVPEIVQEDYSSQKGAIFLLPYSPGLSTPETLIENFGLIDEKLLLFMENIKKLSFEDLIHGSKWEIKTPETPEPYQSLVIKGRGKTKYSTVSLINTLRDEPKKWVVYHRDLSVKGQTLVPEGKQGIKRTRITVAFPLDDDLREETRKAGVFYCYLPTKKRTDLPFLIQADFLPTIGRENVADHPWNTWLMRELGILAGDAINNVKKDESLTKVVYEFIPLAGEVQDELVKVLYRSLFEALKHTRIAKGTESWLRPEDCLIPNNEDLRSILSETDLRSLFNQRASYLDPALSARDTYPRPENVLFELGARKIEEDDLVDFLQKKGAVLKKSKRWFLDLYDYLSGIFDISKKSYGEDFPWDWEESIKNLFGRLQLTRFILTDKGDVVSLKDPNVQDRIICYPQRIDLSEIHKLFTEGEIIFLNRYFQESGITRHKEDNPDTEEKRKRVKDWFDGIGVQKYFKQAHIIRKVILPKFKTGKYKKYSDLRLYNFINYIRKYWSSIESEIQNKKMSTEIIAEIKDFVRLKAYSQHADSTVQDHKLPTEIYFSKQYGKNETMEDLFAGIDDIYFLSPRYTSKAKREPKTIKKGRRRTDYSWKDFLRILGVWSSPRVVKDTEPLSIRGIDEYKWVQKEWSPRGIHELIGNSKSRDLELLIEYCANELSPEESKARMILLWGSLEKNWKFYKDSKFCETRYEWFHTSQHPKTYQTSSFLEFLRDSEWVPTMSGNFFKPGDLFVHTPNNLYLLGDGVEYTDLKGHDAFLKDLGIHMEPEIDEVLAHIKSYKGNSVSRSGSKIKKMETVYAFLHKKLNAKGFDENQKQARIEEVRKDFHNHELVYLPREDRAWWKPEDVFWYDMSDTFGTLWGYMQHLGHPIYEESLKPFFSSVGVADRPSVDDCLEVLGRLKTKGDINYYKVFVSKIYSFVDHLLKQGVQSIISWEEPIFLSENDLFLPPSALYYSDGEEFRKLFGDAVEIIWLPFHWHNIENMLREGGFQRLGQKVSLSKKFGHLYEIEGGLTNQFIKRIRCAKSYLRRKKFDLFIKLQREGVFNRIEVLQLYETPKILIDYVLHMGGKNPVSIRGSEKDVYLSLDENRLYKSCQVPLFSTPVAMEVSRLFGYGEDEVSSVLDSLFSAVDDEQLYSKLRNFGIDEWAETEGDSPNGVKIITESGEENQQKDEEDKRAKESQEEKKPKSSSKSKPEPRKSDLVDPDSLVFETGEEHTPYVKSEGSQNIPPKDIKLRPEHRGVDGKERERDIKPREIANRADGESIALELAMRFEEDIENRQVDDRHKQFGIGYDIHSLGPDSSERFIEVKHFRGEAGAWELTPHQWKKAEQEGDKYWVYVVSGLKEEASPKIELIQDPVKYLTPDPPIQKCFSDWKNGILKVIRSKKV